jgi:hypothetical protein
VQELKCRLPAADIEAVGSLRVLLVGLLLTVVVAGCGGTGERGRYKNALARPLLRLDSATGDAVRTISAFERGRLSFRKAATGVNRASRRVEAARKSIAAVDPPSRYAVAHRGLEHSAVLLRQALDAYDGYLREFVAAVQAFRTSHAGSIEAAQATARYQRYAELLRNFQSVAGTASEAADGAMPLPAFVLSYVPPPTVVYVSDKGVFAGTAASSN